MFKLPPNRTARRLAASLAVLVLAMALPRLAAAAPAATEVEAGFYRAQLENGLEVYVLLDHSLPLVTIEMAVRAGAWVEDPSIDGLSHLYEHMFFKGNEVLANQEEYLERVRELGLVFNATTAHECVNYFFTMTSDNKSEGLRFMRDAMRYPLFDPEELARESSVVLDEYSRAESSPFFHLQKAVDNALWYAHPSRKDVIGSREVIANVTHAQMKEMQARFYIPNNAALFIAGDVELEATLAEVDELFGDWQRGEDPFVASPLPEHPPLQETQALIVEQDISRVVVTIQWHGPDTRRDRESTFAADVLMFLVNPPTSDLSKALVDSGLVLGASFGYYTHANVGPISLSFETTADKLEPAIREALAQVRRLDQPSAYSEEQVTVSKILLEVLDLEGREQSSAFTHTLSFWWASAGLEYYLSYLDELRRVSRADMDRFVQRYLSKDKPFVIGIMLSPEQRETLALDAEKVVQWLQ
ncbi:MAG: pitrilysin family protein [Myxococcota bacterium]|nr:pitrilysin family protein [Myxococcota bacterium]